jgi:multidrug efflux pump subunit AcrA (membrane-fusion protein)
MLVLGLTACNDEEVVNSNEIVSTPIEIQVVANEDISNVNRINGSVLAKDEVAIFTPVAGEVTNVYVKVGDKVSKDQVLFTIDNASLVRSYQALVDDYNRTKSLYDSQIALVEQSLEDTKKIYNEQVRLAKQTADNTKALFEVGAATSIDVENAEFGLSQAQIGANSAIEQAQITVTSTKNSAQSTLTQLENGIKDAKDVLELIEVFAKQGHSGFSAFATLETFNLLANFKNIKALTNNPEEWVDVTSFGNGKKLYQSKRNSACFSEDDLKTYYDTSEGDYPKAKIIRRLQEYEG